MMKARRWGFAAALLLGFGAAALAAEAVTKDEDGKYRDANGELTYKIQPDGTVDWYTFSGFRRYHSECHVCHGPDGEGSSFGPALVNSVKNGMTYEQFLEVVVNGRQNLSAGQERVMPAFGENLNVMCYLDDIYIYLKARAEGGLPRGRPQKREDKPQAATENENRCFGQS